MSTAHQTSHLPALANHASDHLEVMRELLGGEGPPARASVQRATRATSALRGSASLLGLDAFQGFLGRLFVILDDVVSSELPWSNSLQEVLRHAVEAEAAYVQALERRDANGKVDVLMRADAHLTSWRRDEAARFEAPGADDSQRSVSQSAVSGSIESRVAELVDQVRQLREDTRSRANGRLATALDILGHELTALQAELGGEDDQSVQVENGLRNHCEGGLRQLVEAAAQEVLDEAQECGMRLAIRATGSVHIADDELGGALLEILRNLWSDSRAAQVGMDHAFIDTVFRIEPQRLIVEVRDAGDVQPRHSDDDVLAGYSGLRRSRPLIESLQGLVWVEPGTPECRFRLTLPRSASEVDATVVQVGAQEVALPASAVETVHPVGDVRLFQDATGAFAEVTGKVHPLLNLALVLGDPSFDALRRERVVIVGSFERRAAILVSGPDRSERSALTHGEAAPWLGRLGGPAGIRLLDVSGLLGRKTTGRARGIETRETQADARQGVLRAAPTAVPVAASSAGATSAASAAPAAVLAVAPASSREAGLVTTVVPTVLVVDGSEVERRALGTLLNGSSYRALVARSVDEAWRSLESEPVKLVLCDLRLPEMNAQQLVEKIRRDGRFKETPIVLILSHVGEQAQLVVQQLGVTDFVRSPVRREELLRVVGRLTEESSVG